MEESTMTETVSRNTSARPRVMFYVQHLLGIGHLARASRIAQALVSDGFEVLVVTGGLPVNGFPGTGVNHLALPPIAVGDAGFSGLVDENGHAVDDAFRQRRTALLLDAFHDFRPDIVVTEAFPFGRRQVRFELLPLIDAIEATQPKPLLLTSLRDILQERAKPGRDEETVALVKAHFDHVLVHGDPAFVRLEETFPLADEITGKVIYTGLVAPAPPPSPAEQFDVVVSAGGGAVGKALLDAALEASSIVHDVKTWCLITGPNLPQADFDALQAKAGANVRLERFRTDFAALLSVARLSVSQAGYNTVCDIMRAGCRALLIPFAAGGETEQTSRAVRLSGLGLAQVLEEADISGIRMADSIGQALALAPPSSYPLQLDGAAQTARIMRQLLTERFSPDETPR